MITWKERNNLLDMYRYTVDEENMYLRKLVNNQELTDDEKTKYKEVRKMVNEIKQILLENKIPF